MQFQNEATVVYVLQLLQHVLEGKPQLVDDSLELQPRPVTDRFISLTLAKRRHFNNNMEKKTQKIQWCNRQHTRIICVTSKLLGPS